MEILKAFPVLGIIFSLSAAAGIYLFFSESDMIAGFIKPHIHRHEEAKSVEGAEIRIDNDLVEVDEDDDTLFL